MKEALKTAMTTSISEVLETMFFMTIDTPESAEESELVNDAMGEKLIGSRINFNGPLSGHFVLMIPENILMDMTEMFMGLAAEDVDGSHLSGTISEAINMIAGNTFSKLDDQAVFNLEIPEMVDVAALLSQASPSDQEKIFFRVETPTGNLGLQLYYSV